MQSTATLAQSCLPISLSQTNSVRRRPMQNLEGSICGILGLCQEIGKRESSKELMNRSRASVLQQLTLGVAQAEDFDTALSLALRRVCEIAGWDYGEAWSFNAEGGYLDCSPAWYAGKINALGRPLPEIEKFRRQSETLTFLPGIGLPGRVWVQQKPEWAKDVSELPQAIFHRAKLAHKLGIKAALGVPILANNEILTVLVFFMVESHPEDQRTVELVSEILRGLGSVLFQKRSEEALRKAEQKYRNIFERSIEGMFQSNPSGEYLLVNTTLAHIYGYDSPTEVMNSIRDIQHQLYVDPSRRIELNRLLQEQDAVWDFQSQCYRKDGTIIWISENARTIRDAHGKIIAYEGTVKDITDRKQAEERFAALVQNSSDTIAILSADGKILYGSPSLDRILGYQPDSLLGHCILDYVHPEDVAMVREVLMPRPKATPGTRSLHPSKFNNPHPSKIMADFSPVTLNNRPDLSFSLKPIEYRFRHADGTWVYLESVTNNRLDDPSIQGIVVNSRDITQRKEAEEQLHQRLVIEAALSQISRLFVSTREPNFNKILARVGIAAGVERAYIFEFDDRLSQFSNTYEWCANPAITQIQNRQNLQIADFPWLMDQLTVLEILNICDVEWLPKAAHAEKAFFLSQNIQSLLIVPLFSQEERLVGFLGFDDRQIQPHWSASHAQLLRVIAQMLSSYYQRKQTEEALRQAERKYRSIFENAVEGIFQTTPSGQYLTANPMLAAIYGYNSPEELIEVLTDIEHQLYVDPQRRSEFRRLLQEQETVWGFESQVYRRDRRIIWISECARTIRDLNGDIIGYEGTVVDITQRKQAEAELHQRDNLLLGVAQAMNHLLTNTNTAQAALDALATLGEAAGVDRVYICELSNPTTAYNFGCSSESHPTLTSCSDCTAREHCQMWIRFEWTRTPQVGLKNGACSIVQLRSSLLDTLLVGETVSLIAQNLNPTEQKLFAQEGTRSSLMVPILVNNEFWGYIGFDDIEVERPWSKSEVSILSAIAASIGGALHRHHQEEMIRHQAYHDRLTGLPNRQLLDERLPMAIEIAKQEKDQLAVMFLDLDRFKIINDTLGHAVGDELLQTAASRLRSCLRDSDIIVRWGGDEFILLLEGITSTEDAAQIAQRLLECLRPVFEIEGNQLYITGSIGLAVYPQDGEDPETLIKNADTALYRVKEQGRNHYQIYSPAMSSEASELLVLDNSLHEALTREEFFLEFQPQVNLKTGAVAGMEALVRWQHPNLGLVPPHTFIPIAEENCEIIKLGWWVLQQAIAQNKAWQDAGLPLIRMMVNLSTREFHHPDLVEIISQMLGEAKLDPHWLGLEISETTAMHDPDLTDSILRQFRTMGISTAIDDFGIGYASLNYLKKFCFQTLKIDKSFVWDIALNAKEAAIVSAIITLGQKLNMSVVAEGVETAVQRDCLLNLNCYEMQGYLFSPSLGSEEATRLLAENNDWL
ncbi:EAL domain-containing protein [Oscillatoria sp. HE19RPO]|uniref:EAL domain-containing protein n=1 Tax=Oscillatoria sp. HE19RPO TaxID=2954806 RepID=UPI0020C48461|nr:EAL domain-containing protein [Oscillatoria sp. HE19RPO]